MNFSSKSGKGIGLLIAGMILAVPLVAQQEVDPDHFDSTTHKAQNQKPAASQRKLASAHSKRTAVSQVSRKSSSKPVSQAAAVVNAEPTTVAVVNKQ